MGLSRPAKLPLLKLPWLCIKCVLQNSDLFAVIYFASISNRTRRIVKTSKYPLKEIGVFPTEYKRISVGDLEGKAENKMFWFFTHNKHDSGVPLVLRRNSPSLRTRSGFDSGTGHYLESYTYGDDLDALKMGVEFMIDLFGCKIIYILIEGNKLSDLARLEISSAEELVMNNGEPVNTTDLIHLLETIKITYACTFYVRFPEDFYCNPRIFKCRELLFGKENSADWVSFDILCQFDVPQLKFWYHRFSKQDIVSYVTHWFNSENRKLTYVEFEFKIPMTIDDFKIDHLNPMPFCEKQRNRWSLNEPWEREDMSSGMDILRKDGLLATFFVKPTVVFFYIWHKRFPDSVENK